MGNTPDTQKEAWDDLQPTLGDKQKAVFDVIQARPSTLFEVCATLGWEVNRVSGRITELKEAGVIQDTNTRRVNPKSGKSGIVWEIRRKNEEQGELFNGLD